MRLNGVVGAFCFGMFLLSQGSWCAEDPKAAATAPESAAAANPTAPTAAATPNPAASSTPASPTPAKPDTAAKTDAAPAADPPAAAQPNADANANSNAPSTAGANANTAASSDANPGTDPNARTEDLPAALLKQEEKYDLSSPEGKLPSIESQALESEYPQAAPEIPANPDEDDFLFKAQKRVEGMLQANVGIQQHYRPSHRFGLWASYNTSLLSKALYRSSQDSGLINNMSDGGFGLGVQMDFSWVEKPNSPQPSNSSLRVRVGLLRATIKPEQSFLDANDSSRLESAMNVFHTAFLLKNAVSLADGIRTWGGGGVFLNYVLWTVRPRLQSDPSSKLLNSLAFGPMVSLGGDFEVGKESELLIEADYQLWKSFSVQVGMKTSL
jgi:hypothetical protein